MSKNKVIVSNSIFMYFRMLVVIAISFYTTRIVFRALGIEDFGLLNLINGFVVLFTFLNASMRSGTQRFLNTSIATGGRYKVNRVFFTSLIIHIIVAILVLFLAETIGLWFLKNGLNIAGNKIVSAQIVYHCSVFMILTTIISVPYQALLLANEKMKVYALISISETFMKFIIALVLSISKEKLLFYVYSLSLISLIVFIIYFIITTFFFPKETRFSRNLNRNLFLEILVFSSWNLIGQIASLGSKQGVQIIFNLFYGITINAALGIANQISALVYNFVSNMQTAFNPQIVQTYASHEIDRHSSLVISASKYSFYLILLTSLPLIIFTERFLAIWLGSSLPENVIYFSKVIILIAIVESTAAPYWMSAHAIGNIRNYQIVLSVILLTNLPLTYLAIIWTDSIEKAFLVSFLVSSTASLYRFLYFYQNIRVDKALLQKYFRDIIITSIFAITIYYFLNKNLKLIYSLDIFQFLIIIILMEIILVIIIFLLFSKNEIIFIKNIISKKLT